MNPFARTWNSLHVRLFVGAALWIVVALALSDIAISALFRQHVTSQFLHELSDHVAELEGLVQMDDAGALRLTRPVSDPRFGAPVSGYYWEVDGLDGPRLKSPSLGDQRLPLTHGPAPIDPQIGRTGPGGASMVVLERDAPASGLRFVVAASESQLEAVLQRFTRLLRISLGLLAAGLMTAAAAQVVIGLRPMRQLRQRLAAVRSGQAERLPDEFPSEVRPLVSDLNALIASNQEMVRRARAQAGNLAHALKGPLAILSDEAERLATSGETEAARVMRQQCDAMSRQIDHQLARARAAAVRAGPAAHASAVEAGSDILAAMVRLYADRGLSFENGLSPDLDVACDREDLREMLANLVDNAAKWAQSRICIRDEAGDSASVVLVVEDDGPGIAPDKRETVFGIGERLDEQKPGTGLGLAIVRDLAELYGGRVGLDRSELGGLAVRLVLPRARP